ncbi:MAG: calcium-binding protein, partial [Cyanobacteria bacterium J06626_18]
FDCFGGVKPFSDIVEVTLAEVTSEADNVTLNTETATVNIFEDEDAVGVVVTESGDSTDVVEGTTGDSYSVVLSSRPTADVTIALTVDEQLTTAATEITFTPDSWDIPQEVTVEAVDDEIDTGVRTSTITHTATSEDTSYSGIEIASVTVSITDDEAPGEGRSADFPIAADEVITFETFGGVGNTETPSPEVAEDADTLVFTGAGLTASNLLLIQQEANLVVGFDPELVAAAGGTSPQVTLTNFALEDFDNLTLTSGVLANIRFDGQTDDSDDIDVVSADAEITDVDRANITTFLNDLDNEVFGLLDSDDVINGQGGNDTLRGRTGNDIIRGGDGDDFIRGGGDDDLLDGGEGSDFIMSDLGNDTLLGRAGNDELFGVDGDDLLRGGAGDDFLGGSRGRDDIRGGEGNDTLSGGFDADTLAGAAGSDTFQYALLEQSLLDPSTPEGNSDVIRGFEIGVDTIDSVNAVSAANVVQAGAVATLDEPGVQAVLNDTTFVANGAATFISGTRTFVAMNDGVAGYQQSSDAVVEITGFTGDLAALEIV